MEIGRVASMWRYPIKSLRGEALTAARVGAEGLEGDRVRALIAHGDQARAGKTYRGKENDRLHMIASADDALELARERGDDVSIDGQAGRYFDGAPVSLLIDRWLDDLRAHVGYDVEALRYRPNFFVTSISGFGLREADLVDRSLVVGEVRLHVCEPIARCVATTYDPQGGPSDPEILAYVARERGNLMGVYCDVLRAGTVRAGDPVELVDR